MRTLFLTSSGLTEKTADLFWQAVGKTPDQSRAILVPSAGVETDGGREGIHVCMERLVSMGIPFDQILVYHLGFLLSTGYERTYSSYLREIPAQFRLLDAQELMEYDMIVFSGGNAETLLHEVNRTGFAEPLKQAVDHGLVYLGISAGSMIAAGNFAPWVGIPGEPLDPSHRPLNSLWGRFQRLEPLSWQTDKLCGFTGISKRSLGERVGVGLSDDPRDRQVTGSPWEKACEKWLFGLVYNLRTFGQ